MDNLINKLGVDKILHFVCGAVIAFAVNVLVIVQEPVMDIAGYFTMTVIGVLISIIVGVMKEIIDSKFDIKDLVATGLGGVFAYAVFAFGMLLRILTVS